MQIKPLSRATCRALLGAGALVAVGGALPLVGNAQPASSYTVPRTPWGDPDLQGKWPGTDMVGVPMQRDEKLGTRNVLTDEEFAEREARAAQQEEQDNADFELENAASTPGGDVGGAVSPPPHWLERGEPQRQASLIVDPPNGRMPAFTAEAQERVRRRCASSAKAAARRTRTPTAASTTAASRAASRARSCRSSTTTARRSCSRRATSRSSTR